LTNLGKRQLLSSFKCCISKTDNPSHPQTPTRWICIQRSYRLQNQNPRTRLAICRKHSCHPWRYGTPSRQPSRLAQALDLSAYQTAQTPRKPSLCLDPFKLTEAATVLPLSQVVLSVQSEWSITVMKVTAIYRSTNPSCDQLNLYRGATLIARIHDQLWIEHVLGPQQRTRWYNGEYIFDVSSKEIDEHCEQRYAR